MAIIASPAGVALTGVFDKSSATVAAEIAEFLSQVERLQTRLGSEFFVCVAREDGDVLKIDLIPAALAPSQTEPGTRPANLTQLQERLQSWHDQSEISTSATAKIAADTESLSDLVAKVKAAQS